MVIVVRGYCYEQDAILHAPLESNFLTLLDEQIYLSTFKELKYMHVRSRFRYSNNTN